MERLFVFADFNWLGKVAKVVLFIIHLFLTCFLLLRFCSKWGFLYVQKLAYLFKKQIGRAHV